VRGAKKSTVGNLTSVRSLRYVDALRHGNQAEADLSLRWSTIKITMIFKW
jgi:hypothetical protein